jgi:hypothetical protein
LVRDLLVFSVVRYLANEQFDWQLDAVTYATRRFVLSQSKPLSDPKYCALFSPQELRNKLRDAGNMFADAPVTEFQKDVCLPRHSKILVGKDKIVISSRVVRLTVQGSFLGLSTRSSDPSAPAPVLPNGEPRFIDVTVGVRVITEFLPLRAQDKNLPQYQAWSKRFVDALKMRLLPS